MLSLLRVRNLATVEAVSIEFRQGFNVLSGETGAGKSILVDALQLVTGSRADSSLVRAGTERAEVTAVFEPPAESDLWQACDAVGIEAEDGQIIVRRELNASGRNRCFVNDQPVPLSTLKELGQRALDVHGQHASLALLQTTRQRALLDEYAGNAALLAAVASAAEEWSATQVALADLPDAEALPRELERLEYEIAEFDGLDLAADRLQTLLHEQKALSHVTETQQACTEALALLEDADRAALGTLASAAEVLRRTLEFAPELGEALRMLDEAAINCGEAAQEIRHRVADFDADPQRLAEVEAEISRRFSLARRHRCEDTELAEVAAELARRHAELADSSERREALATQAEALMARYHEHAEALHQARCQAGDRLAAEVAPLLHELGLPRARFKVAVEKIDEQVPRPHGVDTVELLVTANPDLPAGPIGKIASGGELSRVGLAIQVLTAHGKGIPTMVFDEVDAGIGGGVANAVGAQLRALGQYSQVLCVTHLAQVACRADAHYLIEKSFSEEKTRTDVTLLDETARQQEVARMLGGDGDSSGALQHAAEMLAQDAAGALPQQASLSLGQSAES